MNTIDHPSDPSPSLDPQRTQQLRAFLTEEAIAAGPGRRPVGSPSAHPARRRVLVGAAAALLLGGVIVTANSLAGGPGVRPAVAIEASDGWTTVRLTDIDADPGAVVAQLQAAGIKARLQKLPSGSGTDQPLTVTGSGHGSGNAAGASMAMVGNTSGHPGAHGLVGLSVATGDADISVGAGSTAPTPPPGAVVHSNAASGGGTVTRVEGGGGSAPAGSITASAPPGAPSPEADMASHGIRIDQGAISIRNGSDNTVVVFTD